MIYLASSSSLGYPSNWTRTISDIEAAFNAAAGVKSWCRATNNVWLLETEDTLHATELREILSKASHKNAWGDRNEDIVMSVGDITSLNFSAVRSKEAVQWIREHVHGEGNDAPPPTPPKKPPGPKKPRKFDI